MLGAGASRSEVQAAVEDIKRSIDGDAPFGSQIDARAAEAMQKMEDAAVQDRSSSGKVGAEGAKRLAMDAIDRAGFAGVNGERV